MNSEKRPDFKVAHQAKLSARWTAISPLSEELPMLLRISWA
jgi:hypothetical protein